MIEKLENAALSAALCYEKMPNQIRGSVIICAGGAYVWRSPREEWPVAHAFAEAGYQSYILQYSVGSEHAPLGLKPLRQLAWAVEAVRALEQDRSDFVAVCGFSAGGHLCSTLGVHWNDDSVFEKEKQPLIRPDGMILCYAATSLAGLEESEFARILYGTDERLRLYLDNIRHVSAASVPAFLWHTVPDELVECGMSLQFAQRLLLHRVFAELHLFPQGKHGLSLATPNVDDPPNSRYADEHVAAWLPLALQWLAQLKAVLGK